MQHKKDLMRSLSMVSFLFILGVCLTVACKETGGREAAGRFVSLASVHSVEVQTWHSCIDKIAGSQV